MKSDERDALARQQVEQASARGHRPVAVVVAAPAPARLLERYRRMRERIAADKEALACALHHHRHVAGRVSAGLDKRKPGDDRLAGLAPLRFRLQSLEDARA